MSFLSNVNPELIGNIVHVVPDIETLGIDSNSVILSIGAVAVCNNQIVGEFYANVKGAEDLVNLGFVADQATIDWWNNPEREEAKKSLNEDQRDIIDALKHYAQWLNKVNATYSWGYGSDFDNVIIANAFKRMKVENPIRWYNHRCLRTLASALDVPINRDKGVHHNALADAINQGQALIKCLKHIAAFKYIEENITDPHCCR